MKGLIPAILGFVLFVGVFLVMIAINYVPPVGETTTCTVTDKITMREYRKANQYFVDTSNCGRLEVSTHDDIETGRTYSVEVFKSNTQEPHLSKNWVEQ